MNRYQAARRAQDLYTDAWRVGHVRIRRKSVKLRYEVCATARLFFGRDGRPQPNQAITRVGCGETWEEAFDHIDRQEKGNYRR